MILVVYKLELESRREGKGHLICQRWTTQKSDYLHGRQKRLIERQFFGIVSQK